MKTTKVVLLVEQISFLLCQQIGTKMYYNILLELNYNEVLLLFIKLTTMLTSINSKSHRAKSSHRFFLPSKNPNIFYPPSITPKSLYVP